MKSETAWTTILTEEDLPPMYERVLVKRRNSNLKLYGQWIYTALVHRVPDKIWSNNEREYSYRAENGCHLWGQDVVSWMRVPE